MSVETIEFENGIPVKAFIRGGYQHPYHWHAALEILLVLKGSVNLGVGDHKLTLRQNDIAIVNMEEVHRIDSNQKDAENNKILFIQVDSAFYRNLLPEESYTFLYCCSPYHEAVLPRKYKAVKEYIARLLRAIAEKPEKDYKSNIEKILSSMLFYISYNFDFLRWGFGTTPFNEKIVKRLRQIAMHVMSNDEIKLKLKELADEAGISLQHLSYDIKNKFGLTFQELLNYGKCEYAARLLLGTDKRIIDIALECGFSDVKYFVKSFKQHFIFNPSKFRKIYRAENKKPRADYREYPLSHALKKRS